MAPPAWWTCERACLSALPSVGAALNKTNDSSPRVSAWSISPCTQERGQRSNSGVGSFIAVSYQESEDKKSEGHQQHSRLPTPRERRTSHRRVAGSPSAEPRL